MGSHGKPWDVPWAVSWDPTVDRGIPQALHGIPVKFPWEPQRPHDIPRDPIKKESRGNSHEKILPYSMEFPRDLPREPMVLHD